MNSQVKTQLNLKKGMQYTFWGLAAGILIVAALLLTHAVQIPSASASATSSKSFGPLGSGYSLVTDANGTRIVYPYQVISYAPGAVTSPRTIGPLGAGYTLVNGPDGVHIIYPYQVKLYDQTPQTDSATVK